MAGPRVSTSPNRPAAIVGVNRNVIADAAQSVQDLRQAAVDAAGPVLQTLSGAAQSVPEVSKPSGGLWDALRNGVGAAARFLTDPDRIAGFLKAAAPVVAGIGVFALCEALTGAETGGLSTIGCAAAAGAIQGALGYQLATPASQRTLGGLLASAGIGAGLGAATAGLFEGLGGLNSAARLAEEGTAADIGETIAGACTRNSFTPATLVLLADGTHKQIKDIKVGDKVLATDPTTGRTQARPVTDLIVGHGQKQLVEISVDTHGAKGNATGTSTITATEGHPFWVADQHRWLDAKDLKPGNLLRTSAGTYVQVSAIRKFAQALTVYNLTVDGIHTYYVVAGNVPVLVHNCGPGSTPSDVADHILSSADPSKVIVIGRTMDRVKAAVGALRAQGVNAKWYQAWTNDPFDPDLAMARNIRWIRTKMNQGHHIVDIGPDVSRADPYGPFYGMENAETTARGYPLHYMDWPSS